VDRELTIVVDTMLASVVLLKLVKFGSKLNNIKRALEQGQRGDGLLENHVRQSQESMEHTIASKFAVAVSNFGLEDQPNGECQLVA
jgi:hypothetical protein